MYTFLSFVTIFITPCICARGKVIGSVVVVVSTKLPTLEKQALDGVQCHQMVKSDEKPSLVCFK